MKPITRAMSKLAKLSKVSESEIVNGTRTLKLVVRKLSTQYLLSLIISEEYTSSGEEDNDEDPQTSSTRTDTVSSDESDDQWTLHVTSTSEDETESFIDVESSEVNVEDSPIRNSTFWNKMSCARYNLKDVLNEKQHKTKRKQ